MRMRMRDVADVEQQPVAAARAAGEPDVGIHRDVVALIRSGVGPPPAAATGRRPAPAATVRAAAGAAALRSRRRRAASARRRARLDAARRRAETGEDARRAHDRRLLRRRERHLDHFEAEARAVFGSSIGAVLAAGQFLSRTDAGRPGHIDVDVGLVARIGDHRVRVRAAAGLHVGDVLRVGDVRDVEDANAAQAILADRLGHALDAAVDAARSGLRPRRTAGSCRPTRHSATRGRHTSAPAPASWDSRCRRSGSRCSCPGWRTCR